MAFCTPAATATAPHATPAPLSSSWKHATVCKWNAGGAGGNQRAALVSATPRHVHASAPATVEEAEAAAPAPPSVDYLAAEFAGHGVSFEAVGRSCAIKMALRNGSAAHLLLPSGLVTSYKPAMWHGTPTEVLHATVSPGPGGLPVVRGGVSMDFLCATGSAGAGGVWSPGGAWSLRDVRGGPTGSIEVEIVAVAPENTAELVAVVTLHPEALASEFTVRNGSSSAMALSAAVTNHLRVSTPDATYALGLQGSDYRSREPMLSEFSIIPPDMRAQLAGRRTPQRWPADRGFDVLLSGGRSSAVAAQEPDGEEDDDYKHLTEELCRIYSNAPRGFTIIDRGRRNSICMERRGFEELYVFSPGSKYEWYGQYAYVCVGPAMLEPVALGPGATWQGAQYLRNPNL